MQTWARECYTKVNLQNIVPHSGTDVKCKFAHFAEDRGVCLFVAERFEHARRELVLRVGLRGVAHHAFFFRELLVEEQRVFPIELRGGCHDVSPVPTRVSFRDVSF